MVKMKVYNPMKHQERFRRPYTIENVRTYSTHRYFQITGGNSETMLDWKSRN